MTYQGDILNYVWNPQKEEGPTSPWGLGTGTTPTPSEHDDDDDDDDDDDYRFQYLWT